MATVNVREPESQISGQTRHQHAGIGQAGKDVVFQWNDPPGASVPIAAEYHPGRYTDKIICERLGMFIFSHVWDLFLFGLDLGNLVPIFRNQEVSFAVLLNMSEADLEKVCITFIFVNCLV